VRRKALRSGSATSGSVCAYVALRSTSTTSRDGAAGQCAGVWRGRVPRRARSRRRRSARGRGARGSSTQTVRSAGSAAARAARRGPRLIASNVSISASAPCLAHARGNAYRGARPGGPARSPVAPRATRSSGRWWPGRREACAPRPGRHPSPAEVEVGGELEHLGRAGVRRRPRRGVVEAPSPSQAA
jgi:hypothetical protein